MCDGAHIEIEDNLQESIPHSTMWMHRMELGSSWQQVPSSIEPSHRPQTMYLKDTNIKEKHCGCDSVSRMLAQLAMGLGFDPQFYINLVWCHKYEKAGIQGCLCRHRSSRPR